MSIGDFLDDAAMNLRTASRRLDNVRWDTYQAAAVVVARNALYVELGRFLTAVRIFPFPAQQAIAKVARLADSGELEAATTMATGIKAATMDIPPLLSELIKGSRSPAALAVLSAATSIGLASEVVATHTSPAEEGAAPGTGRTLSREGASLARGAERRLLAGEIARLATAGMDIDRALLQARDYAPHLLHDQQWRLLREWAGSGFTGLLHQLAQAPPAVLTRNIKPAIAATPTGQLAAITTWQHAAAAVENVRAAVYRDSQLATTGVIAATARAGFAATAARWSMTGKAAPDTDTSRTGNAWRAVAHAAEAVADVRDGLATHLIDALDLTVDFMRRHTAGRTKRAASTEFRLAWAVQREARFLCFELAETLGRPGHRHHLMTTTAAAPELGVVVRGVRQFTASRVWTPVGATSPPELHQLQEALETVALAPTPIRLPAPRSFRTTFNQPTATPATAAGIAYQGMQRLNDVLNNTGWQQQPTRSPPGNGPPQPEPTSQNLKSR